MTCQSPLTLSSLFPNHQISYSSPKPPEPIILLLFQEKKWRSKPLMNTPSMDKPVENLFNTDGRCQVLWAVQKVRSAVNHSGHAQLCGAKEKDEGTRWAGKGLWCVGQRKRRKVRQNHKCNGKLENWKKFLVPAPVSLLQKDLNKTGKEHLPWTDFQHLWYCTDCRWTSCFNCTKYF